MTPFRPASFVLPFSVLLFGLSCGPQSSAAFVEEEHGREPTRVTVFGERVLLFVEHPHLVRGGSARFLAHFTVLATGEPVRSGSVTLELGPTRLTVDGPKRDGLFIPEGSPSEPGTFSGRVILKSEQAEETLELGPIVVHADEASAERAAHADAGEEPASAVPFLLEQQWKVKLLLAQAGPRTLSQRLIVPARAVAAEGRSALVSPALGGRLTAPPGGTFPRTGARVAAGEVLAYVEPPLGAAELAQLHALDLELDLKALDVLRMTGEAETRLRFAERERERLGRLRAEGLGTEQQLELADQNLALARSELAAAGRMKTALEELLARRGTADEGRAGTPLRFALTAPIAGNLVEVLGVPGSSIEAGAPVFRILDSAHVQVEGRASEFDLARLGDASGAVVEFAGLPGRRFELGGRAGQPWIGPEVDPTSRTLLVRYELDNADGAVRPGMLAELHLSTGEQAARVAVPSEAIVLDQGLPTAYVMLEGELFQKRDLELGLRDGGWVEVLSGIEPGERVATRGAYIVKLAALSPASFGAGHAH